MSNSESAAQSITDYSEATLSQCSPSARKAALVIVIRNMRELYGNCDTDGDAEIDYFKRRHDADNRLRLIILIMITIAIAVSVAFFANIFS